MVETISICEDRIDAAFPHDVDSALSRLCQAGRECSRSLCQGSKPRLIFRTEEMRQSFIDNARTLDRTSRLAQWLSDTNPRLAVQKRGTAVSSIPSINYLNTAFQPT